MKRLKNTVALLFVTLCVLTTGILAQDSKYKKKYDFCSQNNWSSNDSRVSLKELRESTLTAGDVNVDSKNGRITVIGEDRSDVLVRACVRVWGENEEEARSNLQKVNVETSSTIQSDIPRETKGSVSFEIHVPKMTNLDLKSSNGRITISDVDGLIRFKTSNGRVTLSGLAGDVQGRTNNGRITVKLSGNTWQGTGLDVESGNGRVSVYMPSNYAAQMDVGTNNGRFSSAFESLRIPKREGERKRRRSGPHRVEASLNGGGAPIKVKTNNGRVSINSTD